MQPQRGTYLFPYSLAPFSAKIHLALFDDDKEQSPMPERFSTPHSETIEWFSDTCAEIQLSTQLTV